MVFSSLWEKVMALRGVHGRGWCRKGRGAESEPLHFVWNSVSRLVSHVFWELWSTISYFSNLLEVPLFYFCKKKRKVLKQLRERQEGKVVWGWWNFRFRCKAWRNFKPFPELYFHFPEGFLNTHLHYTPRNSHFRLGEGLKHFLRNRLGNGSFS